ERTLHYSDISALRDGDYFEDGKLFNAEGKEVPVMSEGEHGEPPARREAISEH
ncbi:purine permease, partial [Pseudomonas frederiksbergensis]|nr:purine permease [Pseudomonas frederiksbergensis]